MFEENPKRAIALGFFDGIHVGHQALMDMAIKRAKENGAISSVFTFDKHPEKVTRGMNVPLITSPSERKEEIKRYGGVDEVIIARFDNEMMTMEWKRFVSELLVGRFNACHIIAGRNNRFGYKGQGNPDKLEQECKKLGIGYDCIESVEIDGIVVSSTHIRKLISEGDMEGAATFLGHAYSISGCVKHGRKVGRTIGVPTVNIPLEKEMQKPKFGVYASKVICEGNAYYAVTNIGIRPTFEDGGSATIEPHILDFDGDLYGKYIRVELYKYLRPEKRFENVSELKKAIENNIKQTKDFFEEI